MREFRVGDKVVTQAGIFGEVVEINTTLTYPIAVRFRMGTNSFTKEGREYTDNATRFIKHAEAEPVKFEVCDVVEHPEHGKGVVWSVNEHNLCVVFRDGTIRGFTPDKLTMHQKFGCYEEPVKPKQHVLVAPYIFKTASGVYFRTSRMVTEEKAKKSDAFVKWCSDEAIEVEVN